MNAAQRQTWKRFLYGEDTEQEEIVTEPEEPAQEDSGAESMRMKSFSLRFDGKVDIGMITNSLLHILGDNATAEIDIACRLA
jgi:hypothetical protein